MKRLKILVLLLVLAFTLTACNLPGLGTNVSRDVVVATGNTSERQILGQIVIQMIQHYTDLKVDTINNLSSTTLINTAMLNGDLNVVSGMYTGTSLTGELGMEPIKDPKRALQVVQQEYKKRYNRIWYPSYGFENTYAFMVRKDFAEKYHLTKVSQLKDLSGKIRVGVDTSWINRPGDGYKDFQKTYGFSFPKIYPMDIGLVYTALANQEMEVALGYSTDGRIASYHLVLLEDDLHLFPPYDCSPVASAEIVEKYPQLNQVFMKLVGQISSEQMQEMNRQSDEDLVEPVNVAKQFLEKHHYFEDVEVSK